MPVPTMAEPAPDHQKRFQAAVDVIQSLPKDGSYRPSYEVMLRFYGLYKQAMCGPCTMSRPGFWDPVGRYKWDAWSRLGEMSSESAMAAYVDEMKKVAQEVIDTMPMNEKTASLFHHFEPLYVVIDDMPCPPPSLLHLQEGVKYAEQLDEQTEEKPAEDDVIEVDQVPKEEAPTLITIPTYTPTPTLPGEGMLELSLTTSTILHDCGVSEGVVLTSDSESEVFLDSVDSVEQLHCVKASRPPTKVEAVKSNGFQNGHSHAEPPPLHSHPQHPHPHPHAAVPGVMQVGAGQGGEGAGDGKDPPMRRGRHGGREGGGDQSRRERGAPQGGPRQPGRGGGGGGGSVSGDRGGRGGGGGWEGGGPEPSQDAQLQQQIVLALRRLRDDMRSVMERLEEVERLAAVHAENPNWRPCVLCAASQQKEEKWWPFDVSGQTLLLLLLWPFAAHGLMLVLRKARRRHRISS